MFVQAPIIVFLIYAYKQKLYLTILSQTQYNE